MSALLGYIDLSKPSLYYSLAAIAFNPTAWNFVARNGEFCLSLRFVGVGWESFDLPTHCDLRSRLFDDDDDGDDRFPCFG